MNKMNKIEKLFKTIRDNTLTLKECVLNEFSDKEIDILVGMLYNEYFDIRKTLDEQILINRFMCNNYYIYEARVLEAKAKLLYIKAYQMCRSNKKGK